MGSGRAAWRCRLNARHGMCIVQLGICVSVSLKRQPVAALPASQALPTEAAMRFSIFNLAARTGRESAAAALFLLAVAGVAPAQILREANLPGDRQPGAP